MLAFYIIPEARAGIIVLSGETYVYHGGDIC